MCDGVGRLLAISDIHGHGDTLRLLLEAAEYEPGKDQLIMCGDYVDAHDPDKGTLRLVRELIGGGAVALAGNQEVRLVSDNRMNADRDMTGSHMPNSHIQHSDIHMLQSLRYYHIEAGITFVHAGLRPGVPLHRQTVKDLTEIREVFFATADADCGPVVFGHTPTDRLGAPPGQPWRRGRLLGIDTGAKQGERLTLLDLTSGTAYSYSTGERHQANLRLELVRIVRDRSLQLVNR